MIYRVRSEGQGFMVEVEDDEGVILASTYAETLRQAHALQRKARFEGHDVLEPVAAPTQKKGTRK